jgi:pyruvate formate lyase activating enzyme
MNRRELLVSACTIAGGVGIAGRVWQSLSPSQEVPPSNGAGVARAAGGYDRAAAYREIQNLEKAGFPPHEAQFWEKTGEGLVRCLLCPTYCVLRPYERGRCRVRVSLESKLVTYTYGKPCSVAIDPIEKKPVFHLLPGSGSFSIATAGCLLGCRYCQNWQISQVNPESIDAMDLPPEKVVAAAVAEGCRSVAYTYTEPTIFYEYMYDTAVLAKAKGLHNVVVSCGYINPEPLRQLLPLLSVMKVDLKGFTEKFYRSVCGGTLQPVLDTLGILGGSSVLVDVVTLVVPTLNDDLESNRAMFAWLFKTFGTRASLFLSRFHPTYQLRNLPPTPVAIMETLRAEAVAAGLKYVYLGNVPGSDGEHTYCPSCRKLLVGRLGYQITEMNIVKGACPACGTGIPGIWE